MANAVLEGRQGVQMEDASVNNEPESDEELDDKPEDDGEEPAGEEEKADAL